MPFDLKNAGESLDGTDLRILRILLNDARTSTAEIARRVGMSAPSVAERMRRLEENGTIEGYAARINPVAFGLPLGAWLRIRPVPGELARVTEILKAIPEIATCDRVTGEDCFIARVHVRSKRTRLHDCHPASPHPTPNPFHPL